MKKLVGSVALVAFLAGPAMAADMAVYKAPPVVVYNWTGFYAGANIGYSWGTSGSDWNALLPFQPPPLFPTGACSGINPTFLCRSSTDSHKLNGAIGGLQAGHNWQTGNYLLGIETDVQISGQKGDGTSSDSTPNFALPTVVSATHTEKLLWLGTLRGRVGFASDRWLIYATGGLAFGEVAIDGSVTGSGFNGIGITTCVGPFPNQTCTVGNWSNKVTKAGWTIGAGVERAITENWSWKVEYLHVDLGTVSTTFSTVLTCLGNSVQCIPVAPGNGKANSRITDEIIRVGLNYKFDSAIIAKY
jgi:outer membrane immunogenic protein